MRTKATFVAFLLGLALSFSAAAAELPQLFAKSEEGFADAELKVEKVEKNSDGSTTVTAAALVGQERAGLQVIVLPDWHAAKGEQASFIAGWGKIKIRSIGKETETFVHALAKAYGQKIEKSDFSEVTLTAASLQGDPNRVQVAPVMLKVFYESAKEEDYAEAYVNFDLPHGILQFREKDNGYRKAVVAFLTKKSL